MREHRYSHDTDEVIRRLDAARGDATLDQLAWSIAWIERRVRAPVPFGREQLSAVVDALGRAEPAAGEFLPSSVERSLVHRGFEAAADLLKQAFHPYWQFQDDDRRYEVVESRTWLRMFRNTLDNACLVVSLGENARERDAAVLAASLASVDDNFLAMPARYRPSVFG